MPWRWFAIYPVLQLERGGRSCISGMLWDSRSGAAGDEMGISSPPSRWCILWVAHTPPCPVCGTKGLSGQVVVEQKRRAHSSDFLQPSWILMCLLSLLLSLLCWWHCISSHDFFCPLTNSRLQLAGLTLGIQIPGAGRTAATQGLNLTVSLPGPGSRCGSCLSEQSLIKTRTGLTNFFWLTLIPFFVLHMSISCPVSLLQLNSQLIAVL